MKKSAALLLALAMAFLLTSCGGRTEKKEASELYAELAGSAAEDFEYQYDAALKGVKITKYVGNAEEVHIPSEINGDPVKQIRLGSSEITRVEIPDGVTEIGQFAFFSCEKLTAVVIPDSVTHIGAQSFFGCTALTDITIPNGVAVIGDTAFFGCTELRSLTLPDNIMYIGDSFVGCEALTVTYKGREYDHTNFSDLYKEINDR